MTTKKAGSASSLRVVRCSSPQEDGSYRTEQPLLMFSMYNDDTRSLECRASPWPLYNVMEQGIKHNRWQQTTRVYYHYRHGEDPEATVITVREFMEWLLQVIEDFTTAREMMQCDKTSCHPFPPKISEA